MECIDDVTTQKMTNISGMAVRYFCLQKWHDFLAFRDWALNHGYSDRLTIDLIDNDGNYEPSNAGGLTLNHKTNNRNSKAS